MMDEFHFSSADFESICNYAKSGQLSDLKQIIESVSEEDRARFATSTFCPDPSLFLSSPFVVASQHGHLEVLQYLMETFPGLIDINRGATIISKTQHIRTHSVPPLVAGCTNDNLELLKYLINHGADIHQQSLTRATALRAAAYYGYLHIMEYLIQNGADLNKPNCIGSSPLLSTAHNGGAEAALFLLKRGADPNQRTIEGYTAMHEAAQKGKADVVKVLLEFGLSPLFSPSSPESEGYVPCPLFLAASMGQREVFDMLIDHEDCPLECKADAYILLAASIFEYSATTSSEEVDTSLELWVKGLELMEQLDQPLPELPQKEEYLNRTEIRLKDELKSLWNNPDFMVIELPIQCLIVRERCMGIEDQSLIECLVKRATDFLHYGFNKECEGLWARAMLVEETICEAECGHPVYGYCDGIMKDLEADMADYIQGIKIMMVSGYSPNISRVFKSGLNCLRYLEKLKSKADGMVIELDTTILHLLQLLSLWVTQEFDGTEHFAPSDSVLHAACKELVEVLSSCSGVPNLLYSFLQLHHAFFGRDEREIAVTLEMLLSGGAHKYVNETMLNGLLPLHSLFSVNCKEEVLHRCISALIEYGMHLDAVDINGETFLDWKQMNSGAYYHLVSLGPLKLSCFAARAVIRENIDYLNIGLPTHIVSFVKLHHSKFVRHRVSPLKKYFNNDS